ncbi:MAG TPA: hypothetical protein VFL98_03985 [Candidatus Paceibacterota bacterium]|nr:hypothetical protein [Candidatus Paceibacterota bacterium]
MLPYRTSRIVAIIILLFFLAILGYAYFEARGLLYGPQIAIATPKDGPETVHTELIHIRGAATNIQVLTLDGNPIPVTEAGVFDEAFLLAPGYNAIVLSATDKFGRRTEKTIELIYDGTSTAPSSTTATSSNPE